jgi:hypothetical protein
LSIEVIDKEKEEKWFEIGTVSDTGTYSSWLSAKPRTTATGAAADAMHSPL